MPKALPSRAFVTLDGMRGVAALSVAARHTPFIWTMGYPAQWLFESYLAVDFFFALSGFVLAHAYTARLATGMTAFSFMKLRLIRLYPLYLLSMAIAVVALIGNGIGGARPQPSDIAPKLMAAVLFLPSPFMEGLLYPFNFVAWSLLMELLANLGFGLIGRFLRTPLLLVIVGACGWVLVSSVINHRYGLGGSRALDAGVAWSVVEAAFIRVGFSFFGGVLTYRIWQARPPSLRIPPLILVVALFVLLAAFPNAELQAPFDLLCVLLLFPAIIYWGASSNPGPALTPVFAWLGAISYAVYVLQAPLFDLIAVLYFAAPPVLQSVPPYWGVCCLVLLVPLATVADRYFDSPVRRALTRMFAGRRVQVAPVARH